MGSGIQSRDQSRRARGRFNRTRQRVYVSQIWAATWEISISLSHYPARSMTILGVNEDHRHRASASPRQSVNVGILNATSPSPTPARSIRALVLPVSPGSGAHRVWPEYFERGNKARSCVTATYVASHVWQKGELLTRYKAEDARRLEPERVDEAAAAVEKTECTQRIRIYGDGQYESATVLR